MQEDDMQENGTKKLMFHVVSVDKIDAPAGMPGTNWYRYVIGQGNAKIDGLKPGTLKAVTEHAQTVADDLNERKDKRGSTYAPRKQQLKK